MVKDDDDTHHLSPEIRSRLLQYLFLNLAYLLKKYNEPIQYGHPQYSSPETGFTIFMFRVSFETYTYVIRCFEALGCKRIIRECGTTIAVIFDTPEENLAQKNEFMSLLAEAEENLVLLIGGKTPQEYYALQVLPVIIDVYNTLSKHFVVLQAEFDAFSRFIWDEFGWGKIIEDDGICSAVDGRDKILVSFYKRRPRDRFVRHLKELGV